ncbi:MAG: SPOR domain-containing protein, partial [Candidatus Korobacteraceae bacterium]
ANILDVKDKTINSIGAAYFSSNLKHLRHLGTFSRGFAAGVLLAVLTTGAFFFHSYRQELGESIIRVGERLAAKAQKQAQVAELPLALPFAEAPAQPALESTAIQHSAQQHPAIQAEPQRAKVPDSNPDLVRMFTVLAPMRRPLPTASSSGLEKASSLEPPEIVFPSTGLAPSSSMILRKSNAMPQLAGSTQLENPEPETYLEVARFKDEFEAHKTMETLERIGLHASVIRKGRLWIDSYYVLVGPYREAGEARAARKTLVSRGFKPRSLERGTRSFGLGSELRLTNLPVPLENFVVNWESYTNDAVVNFVQDNTLVATADARWVRHRCNSDHNAIVYSNNRDGSRTLLEFHFRGMPRALALGNFLDAVSSGGASCCRDSLASGGSPSRSSSRPGSM